MTLVTLQDQFRIPGHPQSATTKRKSNLKEKNTLSDDIDKTTKSM